MKISIKDASSYFRGLLLLIRKDKKVDHSEVDLMKRVGKSLGFEPRFTENAIHEILESTYIAETPPEFSTQELATMFVKDGLTLALSDNSMDPAEEEWLRSIVEKNHLDLTWFLQERDEVLRSHHTVDSLEAEQFVVENGVKTGDQSE